jgi:hypothetical protein
MRDMVVLVELGANNTFYGGKFLHEGLFFALVSMSSPAPDEAGRPCSLRGLMQFEPLSF